MSTQVGFVILSHSHPQQLRRLIDCLQRIYDNPPIAVHHDMSQSSLCREDFPAEVQFVLPHVKTRWGQFSVVNAALRALELLYEKATPDWFFLLSAADYPAMVANRILEHLSACEADALLDYREVPNLAEAADKQLYRIKASKYSLEVGTWRFDRPHATLENLALRHLASPEKLMLVWRRFVGFRLLMPVVRAGPRLGRYTLNLPFNDPRAPFTPEFKCFYGDHWFTGNHRVADILLKPTEQHLQLRRYLRLRPNIDECYYQTVLGNVPGIKISTATRRFADWSLSTGGARQESHPKLLGLDDLPAIVSSGSFFARKFAPKSLALDELDKILF